MSVPLQWQLHPGDQSEADQILHQSLFLLKAADWLVAAGQLQELPAGCRDFFQLVQRRRLCDLKSDKQSISNLWL